MAGPLAIAFLAAWTVAAFTLVARTERRRFGASSRPSALSYVGLVVVFGAVLAGGYSTEVFLSSAFAVAAIAAAEADARRGQLFDSITLPLALIAIASAATAGRIDEAFAGAAIYGGTFAAVYAASRGRAIGFGDVKFIFAFGIIYGPFAGLIGILSACVAGTAARLTVLKAGGRAVPFGPYLAFGSIVALVGGPPFVRDCLHIAR